MSVNSRRVWIVSELYYPELTSTGFFLTAIAEGLAQQHPVSVLCGQPSYSSRGVRAPRQESRNSVEIYRATSPIVNRNFLLFRLISVFMLSLSLFCQACLRIRAQEVVIVVTNPPLLPFLVAVACRLKRARCVLLIHDVYPNVLVASGLAPEGHPIVRLVDSVACRLYRGADHVITIGRDMALLAKAKIGIATRDSSPSSRLSVIPNWGEVEAIQPVGRRGNRLLTELEIEDKFVIQYAGNMGRSHDLESLVACARLLQGDPRFHFLVIGTGAKRQLIERAARELPNLHVLDPLPRSDRNLVLAACDVSVIPLVPGMCGVSVPSRMYNVMASGRPLIAMCDSGAELAKVIREERIGWVIDAGDSAGLAATLRSAIGAVDDLELMGRRGRVAVEQKYTSAQIIEQYASVVRAVEAA